MDEELRKMLEQAKANGASDSDLGKLIDMYEADSLKKKEDPQPSITQKPVLASNGVDTSLASTKPKTPTQPINQKTGFPEVKQLPGIVPDFETAPTAPVSKEKTSVPTKMERLPSRENLPEDYFVAKKPKENIQTLLEKNKGKAEKMGFWEAAGNRLGTGISTVSKSIYDTPKMLLDAVYAPQNYVAEKLDIPSLAVDPEEYAFKNIPSETMDKQIGDYNKKIEGYKKEIGGSATESYDKGQYGNMFKHATLNSLESAPLMVAAMATGGESLAANALMGVSSASTQYDQLNKEHPELSTRQKLSNAAVNGALEVLVGQFMEGVSGNVWKKMLAENGEKATTEMAVNSFKKTMEKVVGKSPIVGVASEYAEERITDGLQQFNDIATGNATEFNWDQNREAGFSSVGFSLPNATALYASKAYVSNDARKKVKAANNQIQQLQKELQNPNITAENRKLIEDNIKTTYANAKKGFGAELKKFKAIPEHEKVELTTIDNANEDFHSQAIDIKHDSNISEESRATLLNNLKLEYKKNVDRKNEILTQTKNEPAPVRNYKEEFKNLPISEFNGFIDQAHKEIGNAKATEKEINDKAFELYKKDLSEKDISTLPNAEAEKYKRDALHELIAELNPDGTKNITYTNEQIEQRANKNFAKDRAEQNKTKTEVNLPLETPQTQEPGTETTENLPENIPEEKPQKTIKEAISDPGKTYVYNGEVGKLSTEGEQVVFQTPTTVHELGNVDEISESTLDKLGIQPESININKDGSLEIEGEVFTNPELENKGKSIKKDKKGNYIVTLINSKGEKVTFRGTQAEEIVYKTKLQSNDQTATTTSPITETESQAEVQKQTETPKIEPEPAVEEPKNEPQTENAPVTNGDVRPGTDAVGEGTAVQQRNTPKSDVQKTKERRESERTSTEKKVTKGKNTFLVYKQDGEYVVVKQKDGRPVNEATRKEILQQHHAENNIYSQGKTAKAKAGEDMVFNNDKEADRFVSENSDNASEVAETIDRNRNNKESVEETRDYTDQKISDALKKNKLDESAWRFGDKNNFVPVKGFSYFAKENGRKVDDLADEINVNPEEILDFINRHPRLSDFKQKPIVDNLIHDLEQRFEKITGVKPTTSTLADAMEQGNRQDETYTHLDLMTEAELNDLYDEIQQSENKQDEKPKSKPKSVPTTTPGQTTQDSGDNQGQQDESGTQGEDFETKPGVKSISKRILEGGNSKAVTNAVASTNINYEKDDQTQTWNKVADLFKEFNSFEMYQAIKNGTITNESAITAAYGQLLEQMPTDIDKELSKITNEDDKATVSQILWDEYGRIVDEFASRATSFGQANAMVNKVIQMAEKVRYNLKRQTEGYKAANNGVVEPEVLRKFEETDAKLKEVEKKIKELEQEKAEQEAQQALENMQAEVQREGAEKPKQTAKKIANKIREFKIHKPNSFSSATPGSLAWDLGVETIAKTVEAGGNITEAIQNGLEKIKNTDWYKSLSPYEQDSARQDFNNSFAQDKEGNIKASTKMTTTPNGVEFPTHLFRDYVKEGMDDIDQIAERIKEDIAEEYPDAEVRDIRDGLSDYGKTINPAKDEISKEMSRLKSLGKLFSAKEDVLEGEMPKKSGLLRAKPDLQMRTLRKEIQAIMKEKGLDTADLEKRWASALDRIKTGLNNQIEELDKQIATGERRKIERTPTQLDQDAKDLKATRDEKRKLLDEIAGKPELSPEQKIKRAERALETSISKIQEQIDSGEFDAKNNNTPLNSPRLEELRNQKAELLKAKKQIRTESGAVEKARLEAAKKRVKTQLAELAQRIKDKNYSKKEIKPIRADAELRQLKEEKIRLFEVYDSAKYKAELLNRSTLQKSYDFLLEVINFMRIASGLDLGLMFLQLGPLTVSRRVTNPVLFAKDMIKVFRAIGSDKFSKKMNTELKAREYYPLAEECKLSLTSIDYRMSINEDQFIGDLSNMLWNSPIGLANRSEKAFNVLNKERTVFGDFLLGRKNGEKMSIAQQWRNSNFYQAVERGLVTYANTLRMQEFERGIEKLRIEGKNQEDNLSEYKKVASAVNTLTGRGNLPTEAAGVNKLLTALFFSPRNVVAIVNQLNPFWYASLQINKEAGFNVEDLKPITIKNGKIQNNLSVANKLAMHNMIRFGTITLTFSLLVKAAYGDDAEEIEWDPRSYNFGKIRIKGKNGAKIVFDPWAGKGRQVAMYYKLWSEESKDIHSGKITPLGKTKRGPKNRGEILEEFVGNKLSPAASFGVSWLTAKTDKIGGKEVKVNKYTGEPIKETFFPSLMPMYWAGLKEVQEQDPSAFTEFLATIAIMGVNTDVVKKPKKKKKKSRDRD